MSLKDKVAIVTGSSSGIGAAIVEKFAEEGARVVIVGRKQAKLDAVEKKVKSLGPSPLVLRADVNNEDDARKIINDTLQHFGKIDILFNNAGIALNSGILQENAMELFDKIIATNLRSTVFLSHLAAPHLIETKGNIINMSSVLSQKVIPTFIYCTSKAAMDHFSRCIALELAPKGVRVNTINPGPVVTDLLENAGVPADHIEQWKETSKNASALKKMADVDEVADLTVFLASDKGRSVTGSSYFIDNGMLLSSEKYQ